MNGSGGEGPSKGSRSLSACKKQELAKKKKIHTHICGMVKLSPYAIRKGASQT